MGTPMSHIHGIHSLYSLSTYCLGFRITDAALNLEIALDDSLLERVDLWRH
jgi:hypothetical protein